MRETFLQSQRTQSLQNMKEKDRRKRKDRGTKNGKYFFLKKMSDGENDKRTQLNCDRSSIFL